MEIILDSGRMWRPRRRRRGGSRVWSAHSGLGSTTQPGVVTGSGMGTSLFLPWLSQFPLLEFWAESSWFSLHRKVEEKAHCWFSRLIVFLSCLCLNHTDMKRFGCCLCLTWGSVSNLGRFLCSTPGALGAVLDGASAGASPGPLFVPQKNKPASSGPEFSFSTTSLLCRCCVFGEICVCGFQAPSLKCFVWLEPNLGTSGLQ